MNILDLINGQGAKAAPGQAPHTCAVQMDAAHIDGRVHYAESQAVKWQEALRVVEARGEDAIEAYVQVAYWEDQTRLWRRTAIRLATARGGTI